MRDLWFKSAIIYGIYVDTFMDGNGDGEGDFIGLKQRLDYLSGLGITCLWLLPFFPSPGRDNGYDITDYYNVDRRLGTLGDFVEFLREAEERGIRVLIDLVINHTSDQHPWFQEARCDPKSKYHDYYVWREDEPEDTSDKVIFPGQEDSIWSYDEEAGKWFLHRFYHHQPDLNMSNPEVREEVRKIMGFWLQLGVSGFRIDAAPYVIEQLGAAETRVPDPFVYWEKFRGFLSWRRGDAVLLAEANEPASQMGEFFHEGRRMHMAFNFLLNKHMYLALAEESAEPVQRAWRSLPEIPQSTQWANFARTHDEINLTHLLESEKQKVFKAFAPNENARIFDRGIRRRLPPLVKGDRRRMELVYSLIFSMPGSPVLMYGEEIGMGDDLALPGRASVRTAMQWSDEPNAEFSTAPAEDLQQPVITAGAFGHKKVNVQDQQRDGESFLNWMNRLIRLRKECPEFGWGKYRHHTTDFPEEVFAHSCQWKEGVVAAFHNFSSRSLEVKVELDKFDVKYDHAVDLYTNEKFKLAKDGICKVRIAPYGHRWMRLKRPRKTGKKK